MVHSTTTVYDPSKLDAAQADGLACITCGRDDQPMKPVDVRDGVQVFACTSHSAATDSEVGLIFRFGAMSSVVIADELGIDVRDFGITDVEDMLSAQELNALVLFVRDLLAKRAAGAA